MSEGHVVIGEVNPYASGSFRIWSGNNDPLRKRWNPYTMQAMSRLVSTSNGSYPMGSGGSMNSIWTSDDDLRLLNELSDRVRQHEFHAGVFLGEGQELAEQATRTMQGIGMTYRHLRRGDLSSAVRSLARSVDSKSINDARKRLKARNIAGAYLSLYYGWVPALKDVYQASIALEKLSTAPRRTSVTASRSKKIDYECSQAPSLYTCPGVKISQKRIELLISEELSIPRSLGLLDPLSVAWELMPLSSVADWFVPIGTYLRILGTIPYVKGVYRTSTKTLISAPACEALSASRVGSNTRYKQVIFQRFAESSSADIPKPTFRGFDQLYSSGWRVSSAAALLAQRLANPVSRKFGLKNV